MAHNERERAHRVVALLAAPGAIAAIAAIDYLNPTGVVFATAYLAVVVFAYSYLGRRDAMAMTVFCALATVGVAFIKGSYAHTIEELIKRGFVLGAIWLAAFVMTRRRELNAAVTRIEARHRAILDSARDGIMTIDLHGVILAVNPAAAKILGYDQTALVGNPLDIIIPPAYRKSHNRAMNDYAAGLMDGSHLIGVTREVEALRRDGVVIPIEITVTDIRTVDERCYCALFRDITTRMEADRRIRENQRTLSTLLSNLPGMAYRCLNDSDWTMTFVSQGCLSLTGHEPYELEGNRAVSYESIIYPADREQVRREVQKGLADDSPYSVSYRIVHKSGELRWVLEKGIGVKSHEGRVLHLEGFISDITREKRIEESLRESEQRFRSIADATPFMIWASGLDMGITFVNARVMEFTGLSYDELVGAGWTRAIHPDDLERVLREYRSSFEAWGPYSVEYRLRRADGQWRRLYVHGLPRFAPGGEFMGFVGSARDITEERQARATLQESEARFRAIADSSPAIIWMSDLKGACTFVNRRWTELTGQPLDEAMGEGWSKHTHAEDFAELLPVVHDAMSKCERMDFEYRVKCRDGIDRCFLAVSVPRLRTGGQCDGYIGLSIDITDRKRTEDALRESEARFRSMADGSPVMIWMSDTKGETVFVNTSMRGFLGPAAERDLSSCWHNAVHTEDVDAAVRAYDEAVAERRSLQIEYRMRRVDGAWRWVLDAGSPRLSDTGQYAGYIGTCYDITERKLAEVALRESEERFRTLANQTPSVIWLADPDGQCEFMNRTWTEITGLSTEESLGHGWLSAMHPDDRARLWPRLEKAIRERTPFEDEFRARACDGTWRVFLNTATPRYAAHGEFLGFVGSAIDVTERRKSEALIGHIAQGVSAATGDEFFRSLTGHLADVLDADMVSIAEPIDATGQHIRTIAFMCDGAIVDDVEYELAGTPCEFTMRDGEYVCARGVREAFPSDVFITENRIEAYIGKALRDAAGGTLGTLWVLFRHPVERPEQALALLRIFAQRVSAELERHRAGEALSDSEQRYRRLFEDAPIPLFEQDLSETRSYLAELARKDVANLPGYLIENPETIRECLRRVRYLGFNRGALAMMGVGVVGTIRRDELAPHVARTFSEETLVSYAQFLGALWNGCTSFEDEILFPGLDGENRRVVMSALLAPGCAADWSRVVISMIDVTAQRKAEEALRLSEERYRQMFDESPMAKFELDLSASRQAIVAAGAKVATDLSSSPAMEPDVLLQCLQGIRIGSVNANCLRTFHAGSANQLRENILSVFTGPTQDALGELMVRLWNGIPTYEVETTFKTLAGETRMAKMHCVLTTQAADDWSQVLVAMVDVTESKQAAEELARAKRLETAGRLAGQIAHDFNNLLGPLVAYPEILQTRLPNEGRAHEMLRDMQDAALQIAEINQELLTLSRRGHYNVEPIDLNKLVAAAIRAAELPSTVSLDLKLFDGPLQVRGGGAQLMRVFANLINNAVEAMDGVGHLAIRIEDVYLDEPIHRYASVNRGEYAVVRIADSGCGIPSEDLESVFEPFFTTKKTDRHRGSGLGLSVVHSVMEDHDGYVDLESTVGRGTAFTLYFPAHHGESIASHSLASFAAGSGEKILVVDDDPLQRRIAQTALEQRGFVVSVLESGEDAVQYVCDHPQNVVILDMVMGGIDGAETLKRIRAMYPDQQAMVLTGYSTSERAQAALALGNCQLLAKPIQVSKLLAAIHSALVESDVGQVSQKPGSLGLGAVS